MHDATVSKIPVPDVALCLTPEENAAEFVELLQLGASPSIHPVTRSPERTRNEALLREEGKWETTVSASVRMRASGLFSPRIQLSYLARRNGSLVSNVDPLNYSALVTVRAPQGVQLYDAVRTQLPLLTPLQGWIPVQVRTS